jgi:uncharacterized protein involved in exopolysaccharide biosynthesis
MAKAPQTSTDSPPWVEADSDRLAELSASNAKEIQRVTRFRQRRIRAPRQRKSLEGQQHLFPGVPTK